MTGRRLRRRAAVTVVALFYAGATFGLVAHPRVAPRTAVPRTRTVTRTITVLSRAGRRPTAGDVPLRPAVAGDVGCASPARTASVAIGCPRSSRAPATSPVVTRAR